VSMRGRRGARADQCGSDDPAAAVSFPRSDMRVAEARCMGRTGNHGLEYVAIWRRVNTYPVASAVAEVDGDSCAFEVGVDTRSSISALQSSPMMPVLRQVAGGQLGRLVLTCEVNVFQCVGGTGHVLNGRGDTARVVRGIAQHHVLLHRGVACAALKPDNGKPLPGCARRRIERVRSSITPIGLMQRTTRWVSHHASWRLNAALAGRAIVPNRA
jgi:hypothetical protein